jgi:Flp pilus assembly pilin Flp
MFSRFPPRFKDNSGVTGIEYALIAALIVVVLTVGGRTMERSVIGAFITVISALCPHDINLDICIRSAESLAPI